MTRARLDEICLAHGVKVDFVRQHGAKFTDLYVGIGAPQSTLTRLYDAILEADPGIGIKFDHVNNREHEDFNKPFLNLQSFWNE